MPTNNLAPKAKNKLGIASSIPPNMAERFGAAVSPYLQGAQALFPPANPYGQVVSNFLLGQAPQAAQQMADGYPNVLFNTSNPLGGNRIVNPVALDMALALPVATAVKGAGMAGGGVAATFAGARAQTANRAALALAEEMKALGTPDEEIYKATGWFFGSADGKPRFEIPDDSSFVDIGRYVESTNPWDPYAVANMGDGFRHKKLYNAYPDLKDASFFMRSQRGNNYTGDYKAATSDAKEQIGVYPNSQENVLKPDTAANKSTTLHELQHAIQQREGFARGGSPEAMFYEQQAATHERINALNDRLAVITKSDASGLNRVARPGFEDVHAAIKQELNSLINTPVDSFGQYQRLAGESEARLTQSRMTMTGEERAASYPPGMYDVPVGDQIVRYGEGPALATTPKVEADFSGTKILDAEGKPLVVYHGTNDVFDTFNPKLTRDIGSHFGTESQAHKFGKNIMPVNLNIRNPLPMEDVFSRRDGLGEAWNTIHYDTDITPAESDKLFNLQKTAQDKWSDNRDVDNTQIKEAKQFWKLAEKVIRRSGFDGIVYRNKVEGDFDSYVAFDPKQIRPAMERNGQAASPESQAIARYREVKGPKSVVRMEAALRTAGVPLPKNEPVAYIQRLVDQAHRRN